MAKFHFVEDYERHVQDLISSHPLDEAMSLAVGGSFKEIGQIEVEILKRAGLKNGMSILDLGCGSGRLASSLASSGIDLTYLGVDVVQALLDYANTITPNSYTFMLNAALNIPVPDSTLDMISGFSIFTHLLHHETFLYMEDSFRALNPGGRLVFSFLELAMPQHWDIFRQTAQDSLNTTLPTLNSFIERNMIQVMSQKIGFEIIYFDPDTPGESTSPLGQSVAILQKPDSISQTT